MTSSLPGRQLGFTLIEVMVALSIVAITLITGLKVAHALVDNAQRQSDVFLAQLCADNSLNALRLSRQFPNVGDSRVDCEQAQKKLSVELVVRPTANPSLRRVDAQVYELDSPLLRVTTVIGRH